MAVIIATTCRAVSVLTGTRCDRPLHHQGSHHGITPTGEGWWT